MQPRSCHRDHAARNLTAGLQYAPSGPKQADAFIVAVAGAPGVVNCASAPPRIRNMRMVSTSPIGELRQHGVAPLHGGNR